MSNKNRGPFPLFRPFEPEPRLPAAQGSRLYGIFRLLPFFFCRLYVRYASTSAVVAQLDRVSGYEPEGRGFESCLPHHQFRSRRFRKGPAVFLFCAFPTRTRAKRFGEKTFCFFSMIMLFFVLSVLTSRGGLDPTLRLIRRHPGFFCFDRRNRSEGSLRRSGREVECTPLLRVQVRIRASGVRIPPSPPEFKAESLRFLPFFLPDFRHGRLPVLFAAR